MALTCPNCQLISPDGSETCDCGWNFASGHLPRGAPIRRSGDQKYRLIFGGVLLAIGAVWIVTGVLQHNLKSSVPFGMVAIGLYNMWRGS
jgi:hypothetical protein